MAPFAADDQPMIPAPSDPGTRKQRAKAWWVGRDASETRKEVICPGHQHRVGLVNVRDEDGVEHLGFRFHHIVTEMGWKIPCRVSLKFACQVEIPNRPDVVCPHVVAERRAVKAWEAEAEQATEEAST